MSSYFDSVLDDYHRGLIGKAGVFAHALKAGEDEGVASVANKLPPELMPEFATQVADLEQNHDDLVWIGVEPASPQAIIDMAKELRKRGLIK
jgi:hypothetical protein